MTGGVSKNKLGNPYGYYRCRDCARQSVRRGELHRQFEHRLNRLSLAPELVPFVEAGIVAAIDEATRQRRTHLRGVREDLRKVEARQRKLTEAFVYREVIPKDMYAAEAGKLRSEHQRITRRIAALSAPGLSKPGEVVAGALSVLTNLTRIWNTAEIAARRRFQRHIYPNGIPVLDGRFGTPRKSPLFNHIAAIQGGQISLGGPTGI